MTFLNKYLCVKDIDMFLYEDHCNLNGSFLRSHFDGIFLKNDSILLKTEVYFLSTSDPTPQTQDLNWTYIRCSEDVLHIFWTSYVPSIYVLFLQGK